MKAPWRPLLICPLCCGTDVRPIVYGLASEDAFEEPVVLAGCIVPEEPPAWQCMSCGERLGLADMGNQSGVRLDSEQACDMLVGGAVERAAEMLRCLKRPEEVLRSALTIAFTEFGIHPSLISREFGMRAGGWDPLPGDIDVVVMDSEEKPRISCELKIDELGQTLWDFLKMSDAAGWNEIRGAYLIAAAPPERWADHSGSELFPAEVGHKRHHPDVADLIERHPRAWKQLLGDGAGQPRQVPKEHTTTTVGRATAPGWEGREIRAARVDRGDGKTVFGPDGWPLGSKHGDGRPRLPRAPRLSGESPFTYPKRFNDSWLAAHVPNMTNDEYAALCTELRRRHWTHDEIASKVRIHLTSMLTRYYWPDCEFHQGEWGQPRQDSFWIECLTDEAAAELTRRQSAALASEAIPRSFLVSRDGRSVVGTLDRYPWHQMWNAYSPFVEIGPFHLRSMTDLRDLQPPDSTG